LNTRNLTTKQILVLVTLSVLEQGRGCNVAHLIINVTGRHNQLTSSVYPILKVLHRDGYVEGKRYLWRPTRAGMNALDRQLAEFENMGKARRQLRRVA